MWTETRLKLATLLQEGYELDTTIHDDQVVYIIADTYSMRMNCMNISSKYKLADTFTLDDYFEKFVGFDNVDTNEDSTTSESSFMYFWRDTGVAGNIFLHDLVQAVYRETRIKL
jgi:hypothetical protein